MILQCDICKRIWQTQYINPPGIVSNTIISKGPSAMEASPESRAIPALMGSFPRAQPCGYAQPRSGEASNDLRQPVTGALDRAEGLLG